MTSLLQVAQTYLSYGWPVIPLSGKLPQVPWKEFQGRYPTEAELTQWFRCKENPPTGLGILTGQLSRLIVVDCDSKKDAEYWLQEHGGSPLVVTTGSGVHFYYRMPLDCEIRNRQRLFGRSIDLRGEGGYVTAPPSLHPLGEPYVWRSFNSTLKLPTFERGWLSRAHEERNLPVTNHRETVRSANRYILKIFAVAGEGGHNQTFRAACKLRDAGLSPEEAFAILSTWNETNATPPWTEKELDHKITSAYGRKAN